MTAWVLVIHGIALAVRIGVHTTFSERAQAVRAIEPHQRGIEGSITIPQKVMLCDRVQPLTIETENTLIGQVVAIG